MHQTSEKRPESRTPSQSSSKVELPAQLSVEREAGGIPTIRPEQVAARPPRGQCSRKDSLDRKSTRLNSSHLVISYAVFCLKNKREYRASLASSNGRVR